MPGNYVVASGEFSLEKYGLLVCTQIQSGIFDVYSLITLLKVNY